MADRSGGEGRQRTPGEANPTRTEHSAGKKEAAKPDDQKRPVSEDAIRTVSGLLSAKTGAFDRLPPQVTLPEASGSLGQVARRLKALPQPRAGFEPFRTSVEIPSVRLPEGEPHVVEPHPDELSRMDPSDIDSRSTEVGATGGNTSARSDVPPPSRRVSKPSASIGGSFRISNPLGEEKDPEPRLASTLSHLLTDARAVAGPRVDDRHDPDPNPAGGRARRPVSTADDGSEPRVDHSKFSAVSGVGSLNLPQEPRETAIPPNSRNLDSGPAGASGVNISGSATGRRFDSSDSDHGTSFVRNPLSPELRNFSMAGPILGEGEESSHRPEGMGADEHAFGPTGSTQGGASIDLSKTNDLLQQLVDAVRKQRAPSLPVGGASVYPER